MTTQPSLAADLIHLFFAALFLIMTMAFLAIPRGLSTTPGKPDAD
jgi:hypothetical protein